MAAPVWFDENAYWNNKLFQLGDEWDAAHLKTALEAAGYSTDAEGLYRHFQDFGNAENLSPNVFFQVPEYLKAKADQLNTLEDGRGFEGHQWDEASVLAAIQAAGLSVWEHYTQYGMYEGVNPSNQFDTSSYLAAKLAQLQADEPDGNWTEASMLEAFRASALNPVEHYALYGQDENLTVPAVPDAEQVFSTFNPYAPSNPGEVFTLTTSADHIAGTSGDDTINGVSSSLSSDRTLNPDDTIDGGAGNDTLHIDMQANFSGFTTGSMTNVENVVLSNGGSIVRMFTAKGVDGVDTYTLDARGAAIHLAELASAGITVNLQGQKQDSTIGFTTDAVKGESDALTLGLNSVGSEERAVAITAAGIEDLTVKATADNHVDLSGAATQSVTVSGAGTLTVTGVAASVESFDASALSGDVDADLRGATVATLKGGAGDDTFTVNKLTPDAVLDGGAGNDTLVLEGVAGALQPTMSGFENITVGQGSTLTISGKNVSDFNSLTVRGNGTAILANVDAADFTVTASGAATGGATLSDAAALTYNTQASADTVKTKGTDTVSAVVSAGKATSATVNVGAHTSQTGTLNFAAATDVSVNVASGLKEDGSEATSFAATLNANKADTLTVNAQGLLGASTFQVGAASSVSVNAAKGGSGVVNIAAGQALDVSVTAGAALNLSGSMFSKAQSVSLVQAKGALSGDVALGNVHQLTVSGADKSSAITLGALGHGGQDYDLTVDASGLAAGFTAGVIDAGTGATVLNFADVTGLATTGTVDGASVTVQASLLGRTAMGNVTADSGNGNIVIDANGMLGGGNAVATGDDALTVGTLTAANGSVSVSFDGGGDVVLGAIDAKSVNLDASGYLGKVGFTAADGTTTATLGTIAAETVTIAGSEIYDNDFGTTATIEANALHFTGGLGVDTVALTAKSGTSLHATLQTGMGADVVTMTGIAGTTQIKASGDLGSDAGDMIEVDGSASTGALTIDLSGLMGYESSAITGGAEDDLITLGAGADKIELGTVAASGMDTIYGFAAGDTLAFKDYAAAVDKTEALGGAADLPAALALLASGGAAELQKGTIAIFSCGGETYLAIDSGDTAGYLAGEDALVHLAGLSVADVTAMGDIFVAA